MTKTYEFESFFTPVGEIIFRNFWQKVLEIVSHPRTDKTALDLAQVFQEFYLTMQNSGDVAMSGARPVPFVDIPKSAAYKIGEELIDDLPAGAKEEYYFINRLSFFLSPYSFEQWAKAKVLLNDDRLIMDGLHVMDRWEEPIMRGMVENCINIHGGQKLSVLELGWGMGLSGNSFLNNKAVSQYTVVEAHPEIANNARATLKNYPRVESDVVEALWGDTGFPPESFDVVFYDTHTMTKDSKTLNLMEIVVEKHFKELRPGGVFTTFFFPGKSSRYILLNKMLDVGFRQVVCSKIEGFTAPRDCDYYPDSARNFFLDMVAIK